MLKELQRHVKGCLKICSMDVNGILKEFKGMIKEIQNNVKGILKVC